MDYLINLCFISGGKEGSRYLDWSLAGPRAER